MSDEKQDRWVPESGEWYWMVWRGDVARWRWVRKNGDGDDRERLSSGLVFRTREEAEAALANLNVDLGVSEENAGPWLPEYGETCWTVSFAEVTKWTWRGEETDYELWARGLLFRTREEADAVLEKSWEEARTENAHDIPPTAASVLTAAAQHMQDRAETYDKPEGERSMAATVAAFNAIAGAGLTEAQGWLFMAVLKQVRLFQRPGYHADSAEDAAAYVALMAEAKAKEIK